MLHKKSLIPLSEAELPTVAEFKKRFNSVEGIQDYVQNMETFLYLAKVRNSFKIYHPRTLRDFLLFGQWYFSSDGMVYQLKKKMADVEDPVLKINLKEYSFHDDGRDFGPDIIAAFFNERNETNGILFDQIHSLPKQKEVCACCGKGWTLDNGFDYLKISTFVTIRFPFNKMNEAYFFRTILSPYPFLNMQKSEPISDRKFLQKGDLVVIQIYNMSIHSSCNAKSFNLEELVLSLLQKSKKDWHAPLKKAYAN